ncbi:hypothetical protein ACFXGT_08305 [Streptomyces sp. NPDC059352]|uniref:hypothetical protein n=1 Tax=Streptomyces sp. NPDC059352 TaxID=3346810 RepID=UPI0036A5EBE8
MTGPEHYREAERLLAQDRAEGLEGTYFFRPESLAAAQVHATLALAAATAMQAGVDGCEPGMDPAEYDAWCSAAGVHAAMGGGPR